MLQLFGYQVAAAATADDRLWSRLDKLVQVSFDMERAHNVIKRRFNPISRANWIYPIENHNLFMLKLAMRFNEV